jgi:hypothetical protein
MEHITKQQLILVCLLVAIVTAVATSVATVSLTDGVGRPEQTIYKVIEKTIDKVSDIPTVKQIVGDNDSKNRPVVLTPKDIAETKSKSLVRIYEVISGEKRFVALGVAVGKKDAIVTSSLMSPLNLSGEYIAVTNEGGVIPVRFEKGGISGDFSVFTLLYDSKVKAKITPLALRGISGLGLGSNVLSLGGKESGDVLSTGLITEMKSSNSVSTSTKDILITDMNLSTNISGWLLFNTLGDLVALEQGIDPVTRTPIFISAKKVEEEIISLL